MNNNKFSDNFSFAEIFGTSYESIQKGAKEGRKIIENTPSGNETQLFSVDQIVTSTDKSTYNFESGLITEVYQDNGYYKYIVFTGCLKRTFRTCDLENLVADYYVKSFTTNYKIGKNYNITVAADNKHIIINGDCYKVVSDKVYTIKVQKTQVRAIGGALGLALFLKGEDFPIWFKNLINNCSPIKKF